MADVIVVGGGVIGAACARELAAHGASVTLLERDELASGASGRNHGLWVTPVDPLLLPMARLTLDSYLAMSPDAPVPFRIDREPVGLVAVATDDEELRLGEVANDPYRAAGVAVETLDAARVRSLEPALAEDVVGGWLVDHGHRLAPAPLTVSLAMLAGADGATVRHHLPARAVLTRGDRIIGVATDDGVLHADEIVIAAGPWSTSVLDPIGWSLPITSARGWLVRLRPPTGQLHHLVASAGWEEATGRWGDRRTRAGDVSAGEVATTTLLHPTTDGSVIAGSSRQPAILPEPEDADVPARIVRAAVRLVPALGEAEVRSAWWGVRPMTPDERPLIGRLAPGLSIATGHGSEGVILAIGTARLLAAQLLGEEPPFDPAPFDPVRFGGAAAR
jgi:sarcosine oxidase subunit beta